MMKRLLAALAAAIALMPTGGAQGSAHAAEWPTKPVKIVVAYAAGGANDLLARVFAEQLSAAFGQQFVVENRTGGGGLIGAEAVARSEPDGYTLMASGMPSHVLAPAMNPKNANFDPVRDFTHIAYLGGPPNVFVVHASSPVKSFRDLLALMRSQANGVEYVSPSIGSVGNMVAEYVAAKEKIKLIHVVYRGGGAAILDLVAGHVKVGSMTLATTLQHIRAGALRPLAVSSGQRVPELPEVPTLVELGYPQLVVTTWYSLSGPAGLPKDIVDRLNREVNKAMDVPKVREHLAQETVETRPMSPEEMTRFMKSEVDKWVPAVRAMNIMVQ
jgi:tripartite-type tricarboxylate transporter receptor subunit TctC